MLFVANLFHFFSCRKVHILGSFQNIKMARTAICNLILGNNSFFGVFSGKNRIGNQGTETRFASQFRVMLKIAGRNSWGLANVGLIEKCRHLFAWIPSVCLLVNGKGLLAYIA